VRHESQAESRIESNARSAQMMMIDDGELDLSLYAGGVYDQADEAADTRRDEQITFVSIPLAPAPRRLSRTLAALRPVCVVLGVTAAPVMAIMGCVGLTLPAASPLNRMATALLCAAVIGLVLALVSAQGERAGLTTAEGTTGKK
jgi:hypothetical protein